jgi:hypothetical protein
MTTNPKDGVLPNWAIEELRRAGKILVVIYLNGEVRGQIECETEGEREEWSKAIEYLNSKRG